MTTESKKKRTTRKKQAMDGARAGGEFWLDPNDIWCVGENETDDRTHVYFDERSAFPPSQAIIDSFARLGGPLRCRVTKIGDQIIAVDGRQSIKAARAIRAAQIEDMRERGADPDDPKNQKLLVRIRATYETPKKGTASRLRQRAMNNVRVVEGPCYRAREAARLREMGAEDDGIALALGLDRRNPEAAIDKLLKLLTLPDRIQDGVDAGEMSPTAAMLLIGMPADKAQKLYDAAVAEGASVSVVRRLKRGTKKKASQRVTKSDWRSIAMRGDALVGAQLAQQPGRVQPKTPLADDPTYRRGLIEGIRVALGDEAIPDWLAEQDD